MTKLFDRLRVTENLEQNKKTEPMLIQFLIYDRKNILMLFLIQRCMLLDFLH